MMPTIMGHRLGDGHKQPLVGGAPDKGRCFGTVRVAEMKLLVRVEGVGIGAGCVHLQTGLGQQDQQPVVDTQQQAGHSRVGGRSRRRGAGGFGVRTRSGAFGLGTAVGD
jgi:hypothetical protein